MTELYIKTLDELLHKDSKKIGDVKRMIERYGIYLYNRWHEWEAAPKDKGGSEQTIKDAISALGEYADLFHEGADQQIMDDYYRKPDNQTICYYGFRVGNNNRLFVENTAVQNQEEQIEQLQSELTSAKNEIDKLKEQLSEISTWTGFADVEEELIPKELDIALQVYRSAIKSYDPETGLINGKHTPREWMIVKVNDDFLPDQEPAAKRIATVANWKKEAGRPKISKK